MPLCPVNQRMPPRSNVAVLRFAPGRSLGNGKTVISSVNGSTRTMALSPPSVIQGAPSGPTMTPWGAEPLPRATSSTRPVAGSRRPSLPVDCAVYQTLPSVATATSCGCDPAGTAYSWTRGAPAPVSGAPVVVGAFELLLLPPPDEQATSTATVSAAAISARRFGATAFDGSGGSSGVERGEAIGFVVELPTDRRGQPPEGR